MVCKHVLLGLITKTLELLESSESRLSILPQIMFLKLIRLPGGFCKIFDLIEFVSNSNYSIADKLKQVKVSLHMKILICVLFHFQY